MSCILACSLYHNCTKAFIKHFDMKVTEVYINSGDSPIVHERKREGERGYVS